MKLVQVQFNAPVRDQWKNRLKEVDDKIKILEPLGRSSFVVSVPNEDAVTTIRSFEEVFRVEPYEVDTHRINPENLKGLGQEVTEEAIAAARLKAATENPQGSPERNITLPGILIASFFTQEDRDLAAENLNNNQNQGIQIVEQLGATELVIDLTESSDAMGAVEVIVSQPGLRALEEETIPTVFNDVARGVIGPGVVSSNPTGLSLTGNGEIIAIADTGLDTGDATTLHPDFQGRVNRITSYPIKSTLSPYVNNPGDDDGPSDKYSGHGTHVAGSALGNGSQAEKLGLSAIPGIAPEANLIFQAIEQTPKWNLKGKQSFWNQGKTPPPSGLFGIPSNLEELFEFAYTNGARIHSNSWGGGVPGAYDLRCLALDRFVWHHKDFLILVAAGNNGKHGSSGTRGIDQGSVDSPGTAKNCLTVGASENDRANQFPDTYGNRWPQTFPYEPFKSDGMVDSIDDIATFSSRGPCQNTNRRKPDVIAPGTFILSTRSSQIPLNNFAWGAYPPAKWHYMYSGGTSMATPLVAGCAALVRQYLREKKDIETPSAALVKATLIHSAQYINYRFAHPSSTPWADNEQGWGRINLKQLLNPDSPTNVLFLEESKGLVTGEYRDYKLEITNSTIPLRVTLAYSDYPGEKLINNLNLILFAPNGKYYLGNDFDNTGKPDKVNNVEGVIIESPEIGTWTIMIVASEILEESQEYALVISAAGGSHT